MNQNTLLHKYLEESTVHLKSAKQLTHLSLSLLRENRLIIKVILELHKSCINIIKAFLEREVSEKSLKLSKKPLENFGLFLERVSPKYLEKEDEKNLIKILQLAKKHKEASLEFVKGEKFVIFGHDTCEIITFETLKALISSVDKAIYAFNIKQKI